MSKRMPPDNSSYVQTSKEQPYCTVGDGPSNESIDGPHSEIVRIVHILLRPLTPLTRFSHLTYFISCLIMRPRRYQHYCGFVPHESLNPCAC